MSLRLVYKTATYLGLPSVRFLLDFPFAIFLLMSSSEKADGVKACSVPVTDF